MNRKINKNGKTLLIALLTLGMLAGSVGSAYAVTALDATAQFTAGVAGASELLDFNSGGSQIYDDWNLHIVTDDDLYLTAPGTTYVSGAMNLAGAFLIGNGNAAGVAETITFGSTGSSSIYDDWNLHIATDDALFIDAPGTTTISGALAVTGASTFTGAITGAGTSTLNDLNVTTNVDAATLVTTGAATVGGDLTVSGGELYVTPVATSASTTEGTIYYDSDDDNLYVYANGAFVDLTLGAGTAVSLDDGYNASAGASAIAVDAGSVTWTLTNASDMIVNINSATSEFKLQDAGTDAWAWDSDATLNVTPIAIGSDIFDITRHNSATGGDIFDIDMGTAAIAGDALDISFGAGVSTGDAIVVDMGATNLAGGALVVTAAGGVRTDSIIDITTASTGAEHVADFNISGVLTGNVLNVDYTGAATGNAIDLNMLTNVAGDAINVASAATTGNGLVMAFTALTTGDMVNLQSPATRTSGSVIEITEAGATGVATAPTIDVNVTSTLTQNVLDITHSGVSTGSSIDLNQGTNVAGDALNINTAATTGHAILIDSSGAISDSLIDIDMSAGDWSGNIFEVTTGSIASDGDVFNLLIEANDVAVQGFVVDNDAVSTTAGWLMDIEADAAFAANMIDIDISAANTAAGDVFSVDYDGDSVWAGDIFQITAGTGAYTGSMFNIDGEGTAASGNMFTIITGNAANTGDVMNVTVEAADVASQVLVINNDAVTTVDGWGLHLTADGAAAAGTSAIYFDQTTNADFLGNIFEYHSGTLAATGSDIFNMTIEGGSVGVQAFVLNNAAITADAIDGWLIDVDTTAAFVGDMISFTNSGNDIWTGSLFSVNGGTAAWTGDVMNVVTGTGDSSGDILQVVMTAGSTDNRVINIDNAAASDLEGWFIDIDTTGLHTADVINFDNDGDNWTGDFIGFTAGGAITTGATFAHIGIESGDTHLRVLDVDNAAIVADATDGWLVDVDNSAAWVGDMFTYHSSGGAWTGDLFQIQTGGDVATGDIFDIQVEVLDAAVQFLKYDMDSVNTQTGWLIDVDSAAAWTGDMIYFDHTAATAWTGNIMDIQTGGGVATGDIFDIAIEANDIDVQVMKVANAAASNTQGWLIDATVTGITVNPGTAIYIDDDATTTGHGIVLDYEAITTGDMMRFEAPATRTDGSVIQIDDAATGTAQAPSVDINVTGAADLPAVDIDSAGVMVDNEGVLSVAGSGATVAGSSILRVSASGTPAAATSYLVDFDYSGATVSNNPVAVYIASGASTASTLQVTDSGAKAAGMGTIEAINTNAGALGAVLTLEHTSASPADDDVITRVDMYGQDDGAAVQQFAKIDTVATDVSATTEDADMKFYVARAGTVTLQLQLDSDVNGILVGDGAAAGIVSSSGAFDLTLETNSGAANEPTITLTDGATGNVTVTAGGTSGEINLASPVLHSSTDSIGGGGGAAALTSSITEITTTGADASTLAAGVEGQIKFVILISDGGDATLTLTGNPATFDVVTFGDVGDAVTLLFTNSLWYVVGANGVTIL